MRTGPGLFVYFTPRLRTAGEELKRKRENGEEKRGKIEKRRRPDAKRDS